MATHCCAYTWSTREKRRLDFNNSFCDEGSQYTANAWFGRGSPGWISFHGTGYVSALGLGTPPIPAPPIPPIPPPPPPPHVDQSCGTSMRTTSNTDIKRTGDVFRVIA